MYIRSSLKKKSIIALSVYLTFFVAVLASITYFVVQSPIRTTLETNLDIKSELLAAEIKSPLDSASSTLGSLVAMAEGNTNIDIADTMLRRLFSPQGSIVVSGGIWPEPYSVDPDVRLASLFYNRSQSGEVDKIDLWNNPQSPGYDIEPWYTSVKHTAPDTVMWSEVYIDPYTHVQMITASSPYYLKGQFAGVVTVDLSLSDLVNYVNSRAQDHGLGIIILDGSRTVITEHNYRLSRDIYVSELAFGDFDWNIKAVNARKGVADQVFEIVTGIEIAIVPMLLLCVMVGYYLINRYLINPVTQIARKAQESRLGGTIDMDYRSLDEIRSLIDNFNRKTMYLERERVKAQASTNAKTAFLATLSHEIRTPMNGVLGTAQLLLKTELTLEQRKHLKTLYDSGDHMMALLNEILDYSKIEQGRLELERVPFSLSSIIGSIHSIYHTLCVEKGLTFEVTSTVPKDRWYIGDKARLRQVLFNLINNAVKFTGQGSVQVHISECEIDGKNTLRMSVSDTGIGISSEAQKRIFKPFEQAESGTTRRYGGTGLGLAIVKQIAKAMHGDIHVHSAPGLGSTFEVTAELSQCEPQKTEAAIEREGNYQGLRVLIVEDNKTNTIIINAFMKKKGFATHSVENGELALKALDEQTYDLILMDNHMPVMDGVETITEIRKLANEKQHTLIFGCTADVFKETREKMLGAGADFILAKPIDDRILNDALHQYSEKLFQFAAARVHS